MGCTTNCLLFCHDETEIQSGYVVARNDCQSLAQQLVNSGWTGSSNNRNTALLEAFAKCMKQKGWGVTSPKKTKTRPGGPNDNSQLAGNPWAPTPYGARAAAPAPQAVQVPPSAAYGRAPQAVQVPRQQVPAQRGYPVAPPPQGAQPYYPPQQQATPQPYAPPQYYYAPQVQPSYNPYPQNYSQMPAASPNYGYVPAPQMPQNSNSFSGGFYGAYDDYEEENPALQGSGLGPQNSNRAGIGLAPGF